MNNENIERNTAEGNDALEAMRGQMREFKALLDRQELVNERLLRKVTTERAAWMTKYQNFQLFFLLPFIYLAFLFIKYQGNISWLFYWATVLMCTVSVGYDTYVNRLGRKGYESLPLLDLAIELGKRRKRRRIQLLVGLPIAFVWMIWYCYEVAGDPFAYGIWVGICIGGIFGALIGFIIMKRMQRTDAETIGDIQQFLDGK